jgi:hypothetical protein
VTDLGDVDPDELAALDRRVESIVRQGSEPDTPPGGNRVANVVARAQTDTLLKDTLELTVARIWATLAALLVPLFVAFTGAPRARPPKERRPDETQAKEEAKPD